ncbi:hypothetical protein HMN09_00735000 [Mycena chlorophos]|uniref:Uncharacterized protein n=1 Tax=Mycena chlorophos TaxID=658473 RepID=A0A8H6SUN7_MYCCL|nr:hypothetical protein HMN09_00735000 [Mycena chlorophos]
MATVDGFYESLRVLWFWTLAPGQDPTCPLATSLLNLSRSSWVYLKPGIHQALTRRLVVLRVGLGMSWGGTGSVRRETWTGWWVG